jgi:hypothetical protein
MRWRFTTAQHEGQLVDIDLDVVQRATKASRTYLFDAAGYQPQAFEEDFPRFQPAA